MGLVYIVGLDCYYSASRVEQSFVHPTLPTFPTFLGTGCWNGWRGLGLSSQVKLAANPIAFAA